MTKLLRAQNLSSIIVGKEPTGHFKRKHGVPNVFLPRLAEQKTGLPDAAQLVNVFLFLRCKYNGFIKIERNKYLFTMLNGLMS